ncbi:hypothetical protein [Isoptericola croceus]|uniref:hypothetical protein n=1 Tax=Isoptericola croceus TaxID=3031406 RepID=UPI0023F9CCCF|nr:hypothetical protein [Isoptericola croceus]
MGHVGRSTEARGAGARREDPAGGAPMVTEYFAAPTDALAATVAHQVNGPSSWARGSGEALFDSVRAPTIDPFVTLGVLGGLLCARPYGEVTAHPRHGTLLSGGSDGPWVVTVSDVVTAELAAATPVRLGDVARSGARSSGPGQIGAEPLADVLCRLGELAGRALAVRHALYCWVLLPDDVSPAV